MLSVTLTTVRARLAEAKAPGARANRGKTGEPQLAAHGVEKTAADIYNKIKTRTALYDEYKLQ